MSKIADYVMGIAEDIVSLEGIIYGADAEYIDERDAYVDEYFHDIAFGGGSDAEFSLFCMLGQGHDADVLSVWSELEPIVS